MDHNFTRTIVKSRKTILELLKDRGYDISEHVNLSISIINNMYKNNQLDMLLTNHTNGKKTYIKYHLNKTLRNSNIIEYIDDLYEYDAILKKTDDLIIIIKENINNSLQNNLKQLLAQDDIFVTVLPIKKLQFNILNHSLVPKHTILCLEDVNELKKNYNINDLNKLPSISRFDPVALALAIRPGQICKILRKSKTAINVPFYRICSD